MSLHDTAGELAPFALAVVKTLVLVTGGAITYYAFKAYRRTGDRPLGILATGFGVVTLGLVLGGMLYEVLGVPLATGVLIESVLALTGFLIIGYSIRADG